MVLGCSMNNIARKLCIGLFLLLSSAISHSSTYEDVIYKSDGSILRGTLIEQDFENKRYKIQLSGGSVFVVEQSDISKITKEAPLHPDVPKERLTHSSTQQTYTPVYKNSMGPLDTHYTFYVGPFSHRRSQPYNPYGFVILDSNLSSNEVFHGVQFGFQHIVSKNLAMLYTIEKAKLKEIVIEDEDTNEDLYTHEPSEDIAFLGKKITATLSTNLYKNWRFFAGLGVFHNDYKKDSGDEKLYGTLVNLGMGYSWSNMQWMLRAGADISNNEQDIDYSLFDISLTMGINF